MKENTPGSLNVYRFLSFTFFLLLVLQPLSADSIDPISNRRGPPVPGKAPADINTLDNIFELIWRYKEDGALRRLEWLLNKNPALISAQDINPAHDTRYMLGGCPPLIHALFTAATNTHKRIDIRSESLALFDVLFKHAADVNLACKKRHHETPLHIAAEKGDLHLISLLLKKGASINVKDSNGFSPLEFAIRSNPESVNLLLHHGASLYPEKNSPLRSAASYYTKPEILEVMLEHIPEDDVSLLEHLKEIHREGIKKLKKYPEYRLEKSMGLIERFLKNPHSFKKQELAKLPLLPPAVNSPLIKALEERKTDTLKKLLGEGASPDSISTDGNMALHIAVKNKDYESLEALLAAGSTTEISNSRGESPLILAAQDPKSIELLLRYHASVDSGDTHKHSALQLTKNQDARLLLLRAGATVNHQSDYGYTPLYYAVSNNDVHGVKTLLEHGADPNLYADEGASPLHEAVKQNAPDIVTLLLAHGADTSYKTASRVTAYDLSISLEHDAISALLKNAGATLKNPESVLRSAVETSKVALVKKLLEDGNNPIGTQSDYPLLLTALRARNQNTEVLALLIMHGAPANISDSQRHNPLHLIQEADAVKLFIEHGVDPNALSSLGEAPLHIHARTANEAIIKELLIHGADPDLKNERGLNALELLLRGPRDERPACGPAPDFQTDGPRFLKAIEHFRDAGRTALHLKNVDFTKEPFYWLQSKDTEAGYKAFREKAFRLMAEKK